MCKVLQIPRNTYYYEYNKQTVDDSDDVISHKMIEIFNANRQCFGTRRIKYELNKLGLKVSRRRIGRIMRVERLVSSYTSLKYGPYPSQSNEWNIMNRLGRDFIRQASMEVLVSDLTYVKVSGKWYYVCVFTDLFNREIVGHSAGPNKDSHLVSTTLSTLKHDLRQVQMFHTDRGKEFDNHLIDDVLYTFDIQKLLSMKGYPYDNAVAETTFKAMKTEFIRQYNFISLQQVKIELLDYVNWYNNQRLHSSLGYKTPTKYKLCLSYC